jgi:hypothetical protein
MLLQHHVGGIEEDGFLRQPFERRVWFTCRCTVCCDTLPLAWYHLAAPGGDERVGVVADADIDFQLVAADHAAGRMNHDGLQTLASSGYSAFCTRSGP